MQRAHHDIAELDLGPVAKRLVGERGSCGLVHVHRQSVLERKASVSRDMVSMRVRLEHADELDVVSCTCLEVLLDRVRGIDNDRDAGVLVADEIRRTAEVVVDELLEKHVSDASTGHGYIS
jgi:hypothetical protein